MIAGDEIDPLVVEIAIPPVKLVAQFRKNRWLPRHFLDIRPASAYYRACVAFREGH